MGMGVFSYSQDAPATDSQETPSGDNKVVGFVYDAKTKQPVSAASVSVEGLGGVFTEDDGSFSMDVNEFTTELSFKKEGYHYKLVSYKGQSTIDVYLVEDTYSSYFDEVELHYLTENKSKSTKALSSYNTPESWKNTGSSAEKVIDHATGINVKSRSGSPGIGSDMFIRGYSSLFAKNQPLVVVDGVIYDINSYAPSILNNATFNPLSYIDVKDIASIVVEKDGGAIYGAKGGRGVIYINTQRATNLATKIEATVEGGINMQPTSLPVLEADDYRIYLSDLLQSQGMTGEDIASMPYMIDDESYPDYYRYHNNTDWQEKVFRNSYTTNYGFKIRGGDEIAKYALSLGYISDEGVVENTNYNRFNTRLNADIKVSEDFLVNASLGISQENRDLVDAGLSLTTNPIYLALTKSPLLHPNVVDENQLVSPNLEDVDVFGVGNPMAVVDGFTGTRANYRFFGNLKANYNITRSLQVSSLVGMTFDKAKENMFSPHVGIQDYQLKLGVGDNRLGSGAVRYNAITSDTRLRYEKAFNNNHKLRMLGGVRLLMNKSESDRTITYNSANDQLTAISDGDASLAEKDGHKGNWNELTYYLANNYSYKNKYLVSVDVSLNGSSRFGDEADGITMFDNVFGVFPSLGLGWIVSSEGFMANAENVDLLKLRASYGLSGNDEIGDYLAQNYYTTNRYFYWTGLVRGNIYNPSLQWETVTKANVGVDMALFNERLNVSLDYFNNVTTNMLTEIPLNDEVGFYSYWGNEGAMKNTGFELALSGRILNGPLTWDMGISVSNYKNEITELPVDRYVNTIAGANVLTEVGQAAGVFYGYKTDGVFASNAEAEASGLENLNENTTTTPFQGGDVRFVDVHKDGVIDEQDMVVIGDPNPTVTGAVSNSFKYNNLKLDVLVSYSIGGDVYNYQRMKLESMSTYENQTMAVLNRWTTDGQVTDIPRASYGDPMGNARFSDRWIEDGSYVRLKDVTLSYNIPFKSDKLSVEMFAKGKNLVTVTNYLGRDPDFSFDSSTLSQGIDLGLTPQFRTVMLGVKIGL